MLYCTVQVECRPSLAPPGTQLMRYTISHLSDALLTILFFSSSLKLPTAIFIRRHRSISLLMIYSELQSLRFISLLTARTKNCCWLDIRAIFNHGISSRAIVCETAHGDWQRFVWVGDCTLVRPSPSAGGRHCNPVAARPLTSFHIAALPAEYVSFIAHSFIAFLLVYSTIHTTLMESAERSVLVDDVY